MISHLENGVIVEKGVAKQHFKLPWIKRLWSASCAHSHSCKNKSSQIRLLAEFHVTFWCLHCSILSSDDDILGSSCLQMNNEFFNKIHRNAFLLLSFKSLRPVRHSWNRGKHRLMYRHLLVLCTNQQNHWKNTTTTMKKIFNMITVCECHKSINVQRLFLYSSINFIVTFFGHVQNLNECVCVLRFKNVTFKVCQVLKRNATIFTNEIVAMI